MLKLPKQLEKIIKEDQKIYSEVLRTVSNFSELLEENKLYFFEDYTDHGIKHIESLMFTCADLIEKRTYENVVSSLDVAVLILAVLVHDIGMHVSIEAFQAMMKGDYDKYRVEELDSKTWIELWHDFETEARKFDSATLLNIFGKDYMFLKIPNIHVKETLDGYDKKLIGEFIRRNHPRMAHEITLAGYLGNNGIIPFAAGMGVEIRSLVGLVARSHGMEIRSLFGYLKNYSESDWMIPYGLNIIYLMILLRLGDIFQINASRIPSYSLQMKTFSSIISYTEFLKHHSIHKIHESFADPETLQVICNPPNSRICHSLKLMFITIQQELDKSWAILGEVYGSRPEKERPSITKRRIKSNIDDLIKYSKSVQYVPDYITLSIEANIIKLLIAPLYGNDVTYGVRELVQNAVDACHERKLIEEKNGNADYKGEIKVVIYKDEGKNIFEIIDDGKGMNALEIKNYFFRIGSSYRNSDEWKRNYVSSLNKTLIPRIGRFGIGILAGFLLGSQIEVVTRRFNESVGYKFDFNLSVTNVELVKGFDFKIGTHIKIAITDEKLDELVKKSLLNVQYYSNDLQKIKVEANDKYVKYTSKFNWDLWYTLGKPGISIKLLDKESYIPYKTPDPSFNENLPDEWCSFNTPAFDKINWTYFNTYANRRLTVNGILIPNGYHIKSNYINKEPVLSIFDFNGNMNLSLNRNSIEKNEIPFNNQLCIEIYKHLLASILMLQIKQHAQSSYQRSGTYGRWIVPQKANGIKHPAFSFIKILYSKRGFIVNLPAFLNRTKNYTLINCEDEPDVGRLYNMEKEDFLINVTRQVSSKSGESDYDVQLGQKMTRDLIEFQTIKSSPFKQALQSELHLNSQKIFNIAKMNLGEESSDVYECYMELLGEDWLIPYNPEERSHKFRHAFHKLEKYFLSSFLSCERDDSL